MQFRNFEDVGENGREEGFEPSPYSINLQKAWRFIISNFKIEHRGHTFVAAWAEFGRTLEDDSGLTMCTDSLLMWRREEHFGYG